MIVVDSELLLAICARRRWHGIVKPTTNQAPPVAQKIQTAEEAAAAAQSFTTSALEPRALKEKKCMYVNIQAKKFCLCSSRHKWSLLLVKYAGAMCSEYHALLYICRGRLCAGLEFVETCHCFSDSSGAALLTTTEINYSGMESFFISDVEWNLLFQQQ